MGAGQTHLGRNQTRESPALHVAHLDDRLMLELSVVCGWLEGCSMGYHGDVQYGREEANVERGTFT